MNQASRDGFNPSIGLSAVLTGARECKHQKATSFNPSIGLSAVLTSMERNPMSKNYLFQSLNRA